MKGDQALEIARRRAEVLVEMKVHTEGRIRICNAPAALQLPIN
jgi:hypothetical protein